MNEGLAKLVDSLLYEGYALYPYTPGSPKNATPTPFGIVYPPAYAEASTVTFDHLRLDCVLAAPPEAELRATVRFLQVAGERHEGSERTLELGPARLSDLLAGDGVPAEFSFEGAEGVQGRAKLRADPAPDPGLARIRVCVHNTTALPDAAAAMDRGAALRWSLLSTHVVVESSAGRFVSPLEAGGPAGEAVAACESVNTFPVLAGDDDRSVLGAAIVLPDHPKMAPESLGNLFDNTEIEEALLLHVHTLSDSEREEIGQGDPAVREMVERAAATTPQEIMGLHGRLEAPDPGPPPEPGHPNPGEEAVEAAGQTLRKGGKVLLRPGTTRDVYDRMLDGRTATIERIYVDYDDAIHVGVTVDGSAEQELFRETGRYLFFKPGEVEAL